MLLSLPSEAEFPFNSFTRVFLLRQTSFVTDHNKTDVLRMHIITLSQRQLNVQSRLFARLLVAVRMFKTAICQYRTFIMKIYKK